MSIGIDHVIIAVEDLAKASEAWQRLGFQVWAGGEHPQFGTHNALIPLADGFYFELMAVKDPTLIDRFPITARLREVLASEKRFLGFALDSNDLNGDVNAIRERGLPVQKAPPGERVRPDGQVVRWRTAHPEDGAMPFLIQDQTPREIRVPAPTQGIGGDMCAECVEVTARDPGVLRQNYARLLGIASDAEGFSLQRGEIRVRSVAATDGIVEIALRAAALSSVAREWGAQGIPFKDESVPNYGRVLMPVNLCGMRMLIM